MSEALAARPRARRRAGWTIAGLLFTGVVTVALLSGWSSLGASAEGVRLARLQQSPQWRDGTFVNPQGTWGDTRRALSRMFERVPGDVPDAPVPVVRTHPMQLATASTRGLRVTWFGHSSTLVQIDGVNVLTDPLWSDRPSPLAWIGPKRWYAPPIALADLPRIDAVVISHDHYDHLDRATIQAMRGWKTMFVVPLGLGAHLARWGIAESRIKELDWWESTRVGELAIHATPSRHHTGRLSPQSDKTLWAGYALVGPSHRVYYSGDTGFFPGLADIGTRLGPFDVAMIEAGQYDPDWPDWHLGPEQAVEASRLVRAEVLIPVHWALLKLAHHSWTEPAERVSAAAACRGVKVAIPPPGRPLDLGEEEAPARWWPALPWHTAAERPVAATRNGAADDRFQLPTCSATAAVRPRETSQ
jgi:L-ascorbate metabolism protein UlaG (beta-lactamase superfamily)